MHPTVSQATTTQMSTSSWYSPLEQPHDVRLLHLQPCIPTRQKSEEIKSFLRSSLLHTWDLDAPADEAHISETPSISLNRPSFIVTPNIFLALKRLRDAEESRVLWIDAICLYFDRY